MNIAVVIASIREHSMREFLKEWEEDLKDTRVILVEDNPEATFDLDWGEYRNVTHLAWQDIEQDLGENAWIIPRRTSAIKSYGFLKAFREDADIIWTLDDDCYPEKYLKGQYLQQVENRFKGFQPQVSWWNTLGSTGMYPRGFPYEIREISRPVAIHHGLWSGVPDLDGVTALDFPDYQVPANLLSSVKTVPQGFFPMCGMNLAFRKAMTPAMYFMLQGQDAHGNYEPFDRFDDIWAGLFAKRICDHLGYAVTSGAPSIRHTKESDPIERVRKEAPGIRAHEKLWQVVDLALDSECTTVGECYEEMALILREEAPRILPEWEDYWLKLSDAMLTWTELCA